MQSRAVALLAIVVLAASACGSSEQSQPGGEQTQTFEQATTISGHGLSIELPTEWEGRVYENETGLRVIRAGNFPLVKSDDGVGRKSYQRMGSDGIHIAIWYWADWPPSGQETALVAATLPLQIGRSDFGNFEGATAPATATRAVTVEGHLVHIFVSFGTPSPSDKTVAEANSVLASFAIR